MYVTSKTTVQKQRIVTTGMLKQCILTNSMHRFKVAATNIKHFLMGYMVHSLMQVVDQESLFWEFQQQH